MNKVFIINYKRTPICGFLSNLSNLSALELGKEVVNKLLLTFDKSLIEKAYIGNVFSSGLGQNIGRQIMYECGINVPSITLNRVCSSGMQSIIEAYKTIKLGENDCIIAGGVESMSNTPFLQSNIRNGNKYGNINLIDSMFNDGLIDPFSKKHMGKIAEDLCKEHNISKEEQDLYAKKSYLNARNANKNEYFKDNIVSITIKTKKGNILINEDEEINKTEDLNKIDKLKSVFAKNGTITPGNASKLSDGACFLILASEKFIKENNIKPIAQIINYDLSVDEPKQFPLVPIKSIKKLCEKENLDISNIDYFEINEAFAIAPIMCHKILNIPNDKINIYGGAISIGHPLGCSGSRIVGTLINILKNNNKNIGCASICNGGGGATSILLKRI